jgi:hypothetical protein
MSCTGELTGIVEEHGLETGRGLHLAHPHRHARTAMSDRADIRRRVPRTDLARIHRPAVS